MIEHVEKYKFLLTSAGRETIVAEVRNFREKHGKNWLKEFKQDFPELAEIVNLAANHNAEEAFQFLRKTIENLLNKQRNFIKRVASRTAALAFLDANKAEVYRLHYELQNEINKKQF